MGLSPPNLCFFGSLFKTIFVVWLLCASSLLAAEPEAEIEVHADRVNATISPYATGACIEDVNHEIYGGLYSQMVFGERFLEPPLTPSPTGFTAYAGNWIVKDGELWAAAGEGPKLVHQRVKLGNGEASVEILFPDKKAGNAGLILHVDRPGIGADHFSGYEIALYPDHGTLLLGRHRQNWEPIQTIPCPVPINQWIPLSVRMQDQTIEISVNGEMLLKHVDSLNPLPPGMVGLRTWQRDAKFRNLKVTTGDQTEAIEFQQVVQTTDVVSGMWRSVRRGDCQGSLSLEPAGYQGRQSQRLTFVSGQGEIGVENSSLNQWGMNFVADRTYDGQVWVKAEQPTKLEIACENRAGAESLAATQLDVKPGDWQRIGFSLTPKRADSHGRLVLSLKQPGSVLCGFVFLQPGDWGRFKDLPVRKDVSDELVRRQLTVLRYGGSMVNNLDYRWKQMIGPRHLRPPYKGTWYPYSTNGWGIIDFLAFCEAAGFLGIPDLSVDESPQDMADFVEYVNGPADSQWGRRRAADGHPAPFKLKFIELGNEEAVNEHYWKKFKPLVEAIWKRDPDIVPIVGDFAYGKHIEDPYNFPGAPSISSLAAHKKILDFASGLGKPVWFDIHIWNDGLRDADPQIEILGEYYDWLGKLSPGSNYRVCVFEENSNNHLWRRGLAHARTVNRLQRFGEKVPIVCAANCLQPDRQNDNGWDQGLVFLSPSRVWSQPSAYVTQMISQNRYPNGVEASSNSPGEALDVTARISDEGKVLVLQVVNSENRPILTRLKISGFDIEGRVAQITLISGHVDERNSEEDPERIVPRERKWRPVLEEGLTTYLFPASSFSVLRFDSTKSATE